MNKIGDTELIINDENRVYHLNLQKHEIANNIILVGDPGRVSQISNKFQKIEYKIKHREFITHTGFYKDKRITAISSGIGTDNVDIVINELDALLNIDFKTKEINKTNIDFHGQNDQQLIFEVSSHINYLDRFCKLEKIL